MTSKALKNLLRHKNPYDHSKTDQFFVDAIKDNLTHHRKHSPAYDEVLTQAQFDESTLKTIKDLERLPFIPTLYYKRHPLLSMPVDKMAIKATSSGTSSGVKSHAGMSYKDLFRGFQMIRRLFSYHKLWSLRRVDYFIFGYEPTKHTDVVIMKSAHGFSKVAPAKSRTYALRWDHAMGDFRVDLDAMKQGLIKASKGRHPIRTIGFPAYTYKLLKEMQEEGIALKMPKGSLVTIGGGWKQFYTEAVEKEVFYQMVKDVLGIEEEQIIEFFGAVEHPVIYPSCQYHRLHVPIYARVIIRDVDTFEPLKPGELGLINLLSPLNQATPLASVMTDDLGRLHEGCPCSAKAPWLEIIGRVGISDIVTCAQAADSNGESEGRR